MNFKKLLILWSVINYYLIINASHIAGGNITYSYVSKGKYAIYFTVFRDCRGIPLTLNSNTGALIGNNKNSACGTISFNPKRIEIIDITPRCSSAGNPCNPANTTTGGQGIEKHVFVDTLDFNEASLKNVLLNGTCCELMLYCSLSALSGAITTGAAGQSLTIYSILNLCDFDWLNKENNSPKFIVPPNIYNCLNQPIVTGFSCTDNEYDSISYELTNPIQNEKFQLISYNSPLSYKIQMTPYCPTPGVVNCKPNPNSKPPRGFYFDTTTGILKFTPSKQSEIGILSVNVNEYKKNKFGKWAKITSQNATALMIILDDCGYNNPPYLTGFNSNYFNVIEKDTLLLNFQNKDETFVPYQVVPDTPILEIIFDKKANAKFTQLDTPVREKKSIFYFVAPKYDTTKNNASFLYAIINDQHCPKPSYTYYGAKINIINPSLKINVTNTSCNSAQVAAFVPYGIENKMKFKLKLYDSLNQIIDSFNGNNAIFRNLKPGKYSVFCTGTYGNSQLSKTVNYIFNPVISINLAGIKKKCLGDSITIKSSMKGFDNSAKYAWKINSAFINNPKNFLFIKNIPTAQIIAVSIADTFNCIAKDSVYIDTFIIPKLLLQNITNTCPNQPILLIAGDSTNTNFEWKNTNNFTNQLLAKKEGKYMVKAQFRNNQCVVYDSTVVKYLPLVKTNAGRDTALCSGDSVLLNANIDLFLPVQYQWKNLNYNSIISNADFCKVKVFNRSQNNKDSVVKIELTATTENNNVFCNSFDTVQILVHPLPVKPKITRTGDVLYTNNSNNYYWYKNYTFLISNFQTIDLGAYGFGNYHVIVKNTYGCVNQSDVFMVNSLKNTKHMLPASVQLVYKNGSLFIQSAVNGKITIINNQGKLIHTHLIQKGENTIAISNISSGIYFVRILDENGNMLVKKIYLNL